MKKILLLFLLIAFSSYAYGAIPAKRHENMPQGVFKKNISGKITQYDKNGKKLGVYKQVNGKYIKVK